MSLLTRITTSTAVLALGAAGVAGALLVGADPASAQPTASASAALSADAAADATLTDASLVAALADATPTPSDPTTTTRTPSGDVKWKKLCTRVPKALTRVEAAQKRFAADANTPGSIAFLEARIAKAQANGNTDAVKVLTDRLTVRKDLAAIIPDRLQQLKNAQEICAKHGAGS